MPDQPAACNLELPSNRPASNLCLPEVLGRGGLRRGQPARIPAAPEGGGGQIGCKPRLGEALSARTDLTRHGQALLVGFVCTIDRLSCSACPLKLSTERAAPSAWSCRYPACYHAVPVFHTDTPAP